MTAAILWTLSILLGALFGLWQGSVFAGTFMFALIFIYLLKE